MSTTQLPPLAPGISADAMAVIPSRLIKRAEKLAADAPTWDITLIDDGFRATLGTATVIFTNNTFTCDCLLSPKCAHIGAVCMVAPIGEDTAENTPDTPTDTVDKRSTDTDVAAQAAWAKKLPPAADIADCVTQATNITTAVCEQGLLNLTARFHMQLLALVQKVRVVGLPRLERSLTALAILSQTARVGKPVGRSEVARQLFAIALTAHLLDRDPTDREAIGASRRTYQPLDLTGADNSTLIPLFAEPIVTTSGFAGISISLMTRRGDTFAITKTPPGKASDVLALWHGAVRLGDLHCSHARLARHTILMGGGKGSADGRIGSGKGVRAALGKEVTLEMIQALQLPGDVALLSGVIVSVSFKELSLNTENGPVTLTFLPSARRTNIRNLVNFINSFAGQERTVTCLVRGTDVVCLWPEDNWMELDDELGGRLFPGLDPVRAVVVQESLNQEKDFFDPPIRGITDILRAWVERCALGGRSAIHTHRAALATDMAQLKDIGAPYAAELLERFVADPTPRNGLSLVVYSFSGV